MPAHVDHAHLVVQDLPVVSAWYQKIIGLKPIETSKSGETLGVAGRQLLSLTTEGNGSPVEYDFIGTGFHVGGGYIVTNRHVVQPWTEDDAVKSMMASSNGRARVKRLVIYFPNYPQPLPLRVREYGQREDLAVATVDPASLPSDVPVLLLSGALDPVTPTAYADQVAKGFPNSRQVVARGFGHIVSLAPCVPRLIATFVDTAGFASLPQSCIDSLERSRRPPMWPDRLAPQP